MMQSTADKVRMALEAKGFKQRGNQWRGNSPLRDSDSGSFVLTINDGEHGAYRDHVTKDAGSLYELATALGIELPQDNRVQVVNTKTKYESLADYATRHYAPVEVFERAGWKFETVWNRPAITWQAATGKRARFVDNRDDGKNAYRWVNDGDSNSNCWYGLNRAIQMAYERSLPIVMCNGEASTIVAQHHGIPAFSGTGGEGAISDDMKTELDSKWTGQVVIALDCDDTGQKASIKIAEKLGRGVIVDLQLSAKGDLADFCGLHTTSAVAAIQRLAKQEQKQIETDVESVIEFVSSKALLSDFTRFVMDDPSLLGRTIKMPFASMREAGGFADIMTTKKVWFIGNTSGGGKTIMSETLCDEFNAMGHNVFYVGDEWSPMELNARRVQRAYHGKDIVTYSDFLHYAHGEYQFTESQELNLAHAMRAIRERYGETFCMYVNTEKAMETPDKIVVFLEDVMKAAALKIRDLRANDKQVDILVIDYLSLYDTRGTANNLEEYKAGVFKAYCKSLDVLGISTVQVNKASEDRVTGHGGMLNQHDLHFVRPDKANLITTMNRIYKPMIEVDPDCEPTKATRPYLDSNGQPEPTPNFAMLVVKNSVGQPFHYAYFHTDYNRLRVVEGLHPDYYFDKFHNFPLHKSFRDEQEQSASQNAKAVNQARDENGKVVQNVMTDEQLSFL